MRLRFKILKSDSRQTRISKKRGRKNIARERLKRVARKQETHFTSVPGSPHLKSTIRYEADIEDFCEHNKIDTWNDKKTVIKLDPDFCLFENPVRVLRSLLGILHNAKRFNHYPKLVYKGSVSFGALYLIDSMCWEIAKARKWRIDHKGLPLADQEIFSSLRSLISSTTSTTHSEMINEKVRIQRGSEANENQGYRKKIKDITDIIERELNALNRNSNGLSQNAYHAINSTIGEHFDNIYLHAPNAQYGTLCGFFDKRARELTILIFNFGETIAENLNRQDLPEEIKEAVEEVIQSHITRKYFIGPKQFTEENAITLLAIQEGISSRLKYDKSRGHGLIDFIENCFNLSGETKISIISGKTVIRIDKTYSISNVEIFGRVRRVLALNSTNDLFEKPDQEFVKNMTTYFPGVLIETRIPIPS